MGCGVCKGATVREQQPLAASPASTAAGGGVSSEAGLPARHIRSRAATRNSHSTEVIKPTRPSVADIAPNQSSQCSSVGDSKDNDHQRRDSRLSQRSKKATADITPSQSRNVLRSATAEDIQQTEVPRWGGGATTVGSIGPGALRTAARPSILTSRVKRDATIFDTYQLTNTILGTGISGAVRVATNKFSSQKFAIKTLLLQNITAKKAAMLHNEVAIYLKLDHPNIVKLIEVYEECSAIHLVMELCEGGELYDRLATKRRYSEADAARVTVQMLEAINYCHYHRICHRDLKLENWVYAGKSEEDPLKLIDFGFSRIFNPGIPMTAMHGTVYYVSPEVMDGCYKEKCDIWSVGVIVYMLLSGSPPFNGSHDHEILIKIKRTQFSFDGPRWSGVSQEAKSFIRTLLVKDPEQRASAAEALKHPWLTQLNCQRNELDVGILTQMRKFALGNVLKRAALGIVALSMTPQEARDVEAQFKMIDTSGSGTIQLHELAAVLIDKLHLSPNECHRIFSRVDLSGDREVHYSEFMASTVAVKLIKDEQRVREAFRKFDVDKNGYITVDNLRQVLGDTYSGTRVEDIVKCSDRKGDNVIDYEEFMAAIMSEPATESLSQEDLSSP